MSNAKQITIFGATGFVGRHLVRQLAKTGAVLRIPTRDMEKALLLKPMGDVGQIVPIPCSVHSDASVTAAIGASDVVINLIGILYEKGRSTFETMHVEVAARIARCAKEQGASQFIHMSALGAESTSTSAYARSKAAGEQAVRAFFPASVTLRPSIIFGPEDNFFNRFAAMAKYSPFLPLIGGGQTRFQPIYVGNIAEAMMKTLDNPLAYGKIFECAGSQIYSFQTLMELMLRVIKRRRTLIDVPWPIATIEAGLLELMGLRLLTRDQVTLLKTDNILVPSSKVQTLHHLGITPTALELILPTYLHRFKATTN